MKKNYYVGSFDPPHLGHLNTYQKAKNTLQEDVAIAICYNEIKGERFLSLEESKQMCEITFGTSDIRVCRTREEMLSLIADSNMIIRGVGRKDDLSDISQIVQHYQFGDIYDKFLLLEIDESYLNISSSAIKQALTQNDTNNIAISQLHPDVYSYLYKRIGGGHTE